MLTLESGAKWQWLLWLFSEEYFDKKDKTGISQICQIVNDCLLKCGQAV